MVEIEETITYPYIVRCWPPSDLAARIAMTAWLDSNVKWDKKLEIASGSPKGEIRPLPNLHYTFRVHSLEDVGLVKMRC